jgi:hypothetical protein
MIDVMLELSILGGAAAVINFVVSRGFARRER